MSGEKNEKHLNVAHIESCSHIYGPGKRFVVWVQGCSLACKGCWNKQMWSHKPNLLIHRKALLEKILKTEKIIGLTLLGGEPLQQPENCLWLLKHVKKAGLDTMVYTGYNKQELDANEQLKQIYNLADILITERYIEELRNTNLQWRGSENQIILFPTGYYSAEIIQEKTQVEVIIDEFGRTTYLGYPDGII